MTDHFPPFMTAEEVADALDISLPTAYSMIRERAIPGVLRAERPMRVSRAAFGEWLKTGGARE
jgi:excisionase family DNA binding protein